MSMLNLGDPFLNDMAEYDMAQRCEPPPPQHSRCPKCQTKATVFRRSKDGLVCVPCAEGKEQDE